MKVLKFVVNQLKMFSEHTAQCFVAFVRETVGLFSLVRGMLPPFEVSPNVVAGVM